MGDAAIDHLTLNGNRRGGEEGATDPIKKREGGTADEGHITYEVCKKIIIFDPSLVCKFIQPSLC